MRILITGITGFVGRHLTAQAQAAGDEVIGLSASGRWHDGPPPQPAHPQDAPVLHQHDLSRTDPAGLEAFLTATAPDVIYHLAAQSNPQASLADPRTTWALNLGGTLNLLEAVRNVSSGAPRLRVVLVGSGVSYGNPAPEYLPVNEHCPLRPNNPYSASKAAADLLAIQHVLSYESHIVIVRPFNHAGPGQSDRYVLSAMARQVALVEAGNAADVAVGNLDITRDFTDVRDVVHAYRLLAAHGVPGEIYNLGAGVGTRLGDALDILRSAAKKTIPVRIDAHRIRAVDQPLLIADPAKLRNATGWIPQWSLTQTLTDMLDYWREHIAH